MKNVIITGASGMVGGIVLNHCLHSSEIRKVTSLVRRPSEFKHEKLSEVTVSDFKNYNDKEELFTNIDIAYFCIGVYTGSVPDNQFKEITFDYTQAFADALHKQSPNATICFLSGAGADPKEKSKMSFARYKGMAENYLLSKKFGTTYIFRPSYIYPVAKRKEPNFTYRISRGLYPILKLLGNNFSIKSTELGEAMFKAGIWGTEMTVLENKDILKIVK